MGPTTRRIPTPSVQWLAALSPAPTMKARWAQARPSEAGTWGGRRGEALGGAEWLGERVLLWMSGPGRGCT